MSSGGLLLLLGLLTLWEVLTPVSSKDRPKFCELPADIGPCEDFTGAFHYSPREHECIEFIYGGCKGNANNFNTLEECESACAA
uniref:Kunitz-type serine protease inhibitor scutellin-3 n=1 Tax=Oxyuranus scutellatus scutellatus TaxID=8667 RepID=VKT3_OXYSC|nr:RecName: Full=Kunitz-type serine protease inhibitor scutellin-3; Flags: Precursor [Oxyuranus scutellatus scutellatus]ABV64391.1 scutellin-3 precursor [Oxyuranus scutellatus]ACC77789.1 scutellin-3 precursor [Oxyuranus scutellatus]